MPDPEILIVKTSSLGDVVHNMPAVTDLRRRHPEARIDWLVEESYVPLVRLHPGVDAAIPVAVRRWRGRLGHAETWREMRAFTRSLRERSYDLVIDTQGLIRSGLLTRLARGRRHGYDSKSIREPLAASFYNMRHTVSRDLHAIDRNRHLVGLAAGYAPQGAPDFGLVRERIGLPERPNAVLLHGTARASKEWAEIHWIAVGKALTAAGCAVALPWGNERERQRSEALAAAIGSGAQVPPREALDGTARLLAASTIVVGLDTGLLHLAAALTVPAVAIFTDTDPALTGPRGAGPLVTLGGKAQPPEPEAVIAAAVKLLSAQPA